MKKRIGPFASAVLFAGLLALVTSVLPASAGAAPLQEQEGLCGGPAPVTPPLNASPAVVQQQEQNALCGESALAAPALSASQRLVQPEARESLPESLASVDPTTTASNGWPHCANGKYCGTPEPDFQCPSCYYWEPCGAQCGCKRIPGCKP